MSFIHRTDHAPLATSHGSPSLSCHTRLAAYSGSTRTAHVRLATGAIGEQHAHFAGSSWKIDHRCISALLPAGSQDHFVSVTAENDTVTPAAFALEFEISDWTREHYVILPGAVYQGNRFEHRDAGYPPTAAATGDVGPDVPTIINDIPRLPLEGTHNLLQQLSADLATPAIGIYDPTSKTGHWLITTQNTRLGQTGIDVEEDLTTGTAVLRFNAPGIRENTKYHCFSTSAPSRDVAHSWKRHEAAILHVRSISFPCHDRTELLEKFLEIRSTLSGPPLLPALLPISAARQLIEDKYNRDNWYEPVGLYSSDTLGCPAVVWDQTPLTKRDPSWQSGWIGGGMIEWPLLVQGSALSQQRARQSLDFICTQAVAPSGFFRGMWRNGHWHDDSFGHSKVEKWHLTRKSADLLLFLAKQIHYAESDAPPAWQSATRNCAEAFIRSWQVDCQIGQFVEEETGALLVGGSDAAAILPAALCAASTALAEVGWIDYAVQIGGYFWARFQRQGFTTGGPGEILSAPDSESAFGLLESMVALYEATGEALWLRRSESVAALCATWCVSYDYLFPQNSTFGALQMTTRGTVIANVQNKHSSPGICTLSGDSLFRLFRATGKPVYLDLIRDIATSLPQFVSREDRPIPARFGGATPAGWICERVNLSDWLEPVGEIFHGSCWCEVSLMLTALELPSIYYQPDTGLLAVLDHLQVRTHHNATNESLLEIGNPTNHPAIIRVLIETSRQALQPLLPGDIARLKSYEIMPGATLSIPFDT